MLRQRWGFEAACSIFSKEGAGARRDHVTTDQEIIAGDAVWPQPIAQADCGPAARISSNWLAIVAR
jgi:hypothetical protein